MWCARYLAQHIDEAVKRLEAARWHKQAGRRVARSDPADGVRHCRRVTTLLAAIPESRDTLMLELTSRIALLEIGRIAGIDEREARDLFDEARAVAERLADKAGHAFLLTSYGRLCGLAGDVGQYLACAERATEFAEGSDAVFEFEMRSVLAHAQLAVGRLAPARATAERALTEVAQVAGLREAVGRSTAPGLCRVWWALASARNRRTALWYEPRILATLADAKRAAGDRSGARALLSEARELVDRGRGWRLGAFDVALAWVRLLASEPASDRTTIESALESLDALTAELGSDPYRRIAALERARLAT